MSLRDEMTRSCGVIVEVYLTSGLELSISLYDLREDGPEMVHVVMTDEFEIIGITIRMSQILSARKKLEEHGADGGRSARPWEKGVLIAWLSDLPSLLELWKALRLLRRKERP